MSKFYAVLTNEQINRLNIINREGKLSDYDVIRILYLAEKGDSQSVAEIDAIILKYYVGDSNDKARICQGN